MEENNVTPRKTASVGQGNISAINGAQIDASISINDDTPLDGIVSQYKGIGDKVGQIAKNAAEDVGARQQELVGNNFGAVNPYMYETYYQPRVNEFKSKMRVEGTQKAMEEGAKRAAKAAQAALAKAQSDAANAANNYNNVIQRARDIKAAEADFSALNGTTTTASEANKFGIATGASKDEVQDAMLGKQLEYDENIKDWDIKEFRDPSTDATLKHVGITREQYDKMSKEEKKALWARKDVGNYWSAQYAHNYIMGTMGKEAAKTFDDNYKTAVNNANAVYDYLQNKTNEMPILKQLKELGDTNINMLRIQTPEVEIVEEFNLFDAKNNKDSVKVRLHYAEEGKNGGKYHIDIPLQELQYKAQGTDKSERINELVTNIRERGYSINGTPEAKQELEEFARETYAKPGSTKSAAPGDTTALLIETQVDFNSVLKSSLGFDLEDMQFLDNMRETKGAQYESLMTQAAAVYAGRDVFIVADGKTKYTSGGKEFTPDEGTIIMYVRPGELKEDGTPKDPDLKKYLDTQKQIFNATAETSPEQKKKWEEEAAKAWDKYSNKISQSAFVSSQTNTPDTGLISEAARFDGKNGDDLSIDGKSVTDIINEFKNLSGHEQYRVYQTLLKRMAENSGTYLSTGTNNDNTIREADLYGSNGKSNISGIEEDYYGSFDVNSNEEAVALFSVISTSVEAWKDGTNKDGNISPDFFAQEQDTNGFLADFATKWVANMASTANFVAQAVKGTANFAIGATVGTASGQFKDLQEASDWAFSDQGGVEFFGQGKSLKDVMSGNLSENAFNYSFKRKEAQQALIADAVNPLMRQWFDDDLTNDNDILPVGYGYSYDDPIVTKYGFNWQAFGAFSSEMLSQAIDPTIVVSAGVGVCKLTANFGGKLAAKYAAATAASTLRKATKAIEAIDNAGDLVRNFGDDAARGIAKVAAGKADDVAREVTANSTGIVNGIVLNADNAATKAGNVLDNYVDDAAKASKEATIGIQGVSKDTMNVVSNETKNAFDVTKNSSINLTKQAALTNAKNDAANKIVNTVAAIVDTDASMFNDLTVYMSRSVAKKFANMNYEAVASKIPKSTLAAMGGEAVVKKAIAETVQRNLKDFFQRGIKRNFELNLLSSMTGLPADAIRDLPDTVIAPFARAAAKMSGATKGNLLTNGFMLSEASSKWISELSPDAMKEALQRVSDAAKRAIKQGKAWKLDDTYRTLGTLGWDKGVRTLIMREAAGEFLRDTAFDITYGYINPNITASGETERETIDEYISNPLNFAFNFGTMSLQYGVPRVWSRYQSGKVASKLEKAQTALNAIEDKDSPKYRAKLQEVEKLVTKAEKYSRKALEKGISYDALKKNLEASNEYLKKADAKWFDASTNNVSTSFKQKLENRKKHKNSNGAVKETLSTERLSNAEVLQQRTVIAVSKNSNNLLRNKRALGDDLPAGLAHADRKTTIKIKRAMMDARAAWVERVDKMKMSKEEKIKFLYEKMAEAGAEAGEHVQGIDASIRHYTDTLFAEAKSNVDKGYKTWDDMKLGYLPMTSVLTSPNESLVYKGMSVSGQNPNAPLDLSAPNPTMTREAFDRDILDALEAGKTEFTFVDSNGVENTLQLNPEGLNFLDDLQTYQNANSAIDIYAPIAGTDGKHFGTAQLKNKGIIIRNAEAAKAHAGDDIKRMKNNINDITAKAKNRSGDITAEKTKANKKLRNLVESDPEKANKITNNKQRINDINVEIEKVSKKTITADNFSEYFQTRNNKGNISVEQGRRLYNVGEAQANSDIKFYTSGKALQGSDGKFTTRSVKKTYIDASGKKINAYIDIKYDERYANLILDSMATGEPTTDLIAYAAMKSDQATPYTWTKDKNGKNRKQYIKEYTPITNEIAYNRTQVNTALLAQVKADQNRAMLSRDALNAKADAMEAENNRGLKTGNNAKYSDKEIADIREKAAQAQGKINQLTDKVRAIEDKKLEEDFFLNNTKIGATIKRDENGFIVRDKNGKPEVEGKFIQIKDRKNPKRHLTAREINTMDLDGAGWETAKDIVTAMCVARGVNDDTSLKRMVADVAGQIRAKHEGESLTMAGFLEDFDRYFPDVEALNKINEYGISKTLTQLENAGININELKKKIDADVLAAGQNVDEDLVGAMRIISLMNEHSGVSRGAGDFDAGIEFENATIDDIGAYGASDIEGHKIDINDAEGATGNIDERLDVTKEAKATNPSELFVKDKDALIERIKAGSNDKQAFLKDLEGFNNYVRKLNNSKDVVATRNKVTKARALKKKILDDNSDALLKAYNSKTNAEFNNAVDLAKRETIHSLYDEGKFIKPNPVQQKALEAYCKKKKIDLPEKGHYTYEMLDVMADATPPDFHYKNKNGEVVYPYKNSVYRALGISPVGDEFGRTKFQAQYHIAQAEVSPFLYDDATQKWLDGLKPEERREALEILGTGTEDARGGQFANTYINYESSTVGGSLKQIHQQANTIAELTVDANIKDREKVVAKKAAAIQAKLEKAANDLPRHEQDWFFADKEKVIEWSNTAPNESAETLELSLMGAAGDIGDDSVRVIPTDGQFVPASKQMGKKSVIDETLLQNTYGGFVDKKTHGIQAETIVDFGDGVDHVIEFAFGSDSDVQSAGVSMMIDGTTVTPDMLDSRAKVDAINKALEESGKEYRLRHIDDASAKATSSTNVDYETTYVAGEASYSKNKTSKLETINVGDKEVKIPTAAKADIEYRMNTPYGEELAKLSDGKKKKINNKNIQVVDMDDPNRAIYTYDLQTKQWSKTRELGPETDAKMPAEKVAQLASGSTDTYTETGTQIGDYLLVENKLDVNDTDRYQELAAKDTTAASKRAEDRLEGIWNNYLDNTTGNEDSAVGQRLKKLQKEKNHLESENAKLLGEEVETADGKTSLKKATKEVDDLETYKKYMTKEELEQVEYSQKVIDDAQSYLDGKADTYTNADGFLFVGDDFYMDGYRRASDYRNNLDVDDSKISDKKQNKKMLKEVNKDIKGKRNKFDTGEGLDGASRKKTIAMIDDTLAQVKGDVDRERRKLGKRKDGTTYELTKKTKDGKTVFDTEKVTDIKAEDILLSNDTYDMMKRVAPESYDPTMIQKIGTASVDLSKTIQDFQLAGGVGAANAYTFTQLRDAIRQDPSMIPKLVEFIGDMKNSKAVNRFVVANKDKLDRIAWVSGDATVVGDLSKSLSKVEGTGTTGILQGLGYKLSGGNRKTFLESRAKGNKIPKALAGVIADDLDLLFNDPTFVTALPVLRSKMLSENYDAAVSHLKKKFKDIPAEDLDKAACQMAYAKVQAFFEPKPGKAFQDFEKTVSTYKDKKLKEVMSSWRGEQHSTTVLDMASNAFFALRYKMMLSGRVINSAEESLGFLNSKRKSLGSDLDFTAENLKNVGNAFVRKAGVNQMAALTGAAVTAFITSKALGIPTPWDDLNFVDEKDGSFDIPDILTKVQTIGQIWLPNAYSDDKGFYVNPNEQIYSLDTMSSIFTLPNSIMKTVDRSVNPEQYSKNIYRGLPFIGQDNPINKVLNSSVATAVGDELIGSNLLSPFKATYENIMNSTYFGNNIWERKYLPNGKENPNYDPGRNIIAGVAHILNFDWFLDGGKNSWVKGGENRVKQDQIGIVAGSGVFQHEYVSAAIALMNGDIAEALVEGGELPIKTQNLSNKARVDLNTSVKNTLAKYYDEYTAAVKNARSNDAKDMAYKDYVQKSADAVAAWSGKWGFPLGQNQELVAASTRMLMAFTALEYDKDMNYVQNTYWKAGEIAQIENFNKDTFLSDEEAKEWLAQGKSYEDFAKEQNRRSDAYNAALDLEYNARQALIDAKYNPKLLEQYSYEDLKNEQRNVNKKIFTSIKLELESPVGEFKNMKAAKAYYETLIENASNKTQKANLAKKYNKFVTDILAKYATEYGAGIFNDAYYHNENLSNAIADYIIIPADKYYTGKSPRASYLKDLFGVGYRDKSNMPSDAEVIERAYNARNAMAKGHMASAMNFVDEALKRIKKGELYASDKDYSTLLNMKANINSRSNN